MPGAEALLVPVMGQGNRLRASEQDSIATARSARERFLASRLRLPSHLLSLRETSQPFAVHYSARLEELCDQIRQTVVKPTSVGSSQKQTISPSTIFWEVDVQNEFMLPGGKLYVAGAEKIIPNVSRLVDACRNGLVFLVSSADAHSPDAWEFSKWPTHCLKGTPGAELIPEARALNRLVIPTQSGFPTPQDPTVYQQVILEKNTLDVFDNPNTDVLLGQLSAAGLSAFGSDVEFVVFGVATEYCVRLTIEGLLRRSRRVSVVTDAIQSLVPAKGAQILKELQSRGTRLLTTEQVLAAIRHSHFTPNSRGAPFLRRKLA